ncbi:MAG TPA: class I tRNA ligase family protein [Adhaeribacter sp.]|nr:class I tRNA ligase family protein [Adhaeribacter sp.]
MPVYFKDGVPHLIKDEELPLVLPEIDEYKPTETGEPPLGRAKDWKYENQYEYELSTMPGWAGSSFYWYRYMDPKNDTEFASKSAIDYWQNVDLYIGGSEHATGHLLYSRFWNQFLFDLDLVPFKEPFKKLINQGMIQGRSNFVYRLSFYRIANANSDKEKLSVKSLPPVFISKNFKDEIDKGNIDKIRPQISKQISEVIKTIKVENPDAQGRFEFDGYTTLHADVSLVENDILDQQAFRNWREEYKDAIFITEENGDYICGWEVEKMSKSKYNVVNPDDLVEKFGADTLRMYEMFLGPLEQFKPWNTSGMDGVHKFLKRFWRLFHDEQGNFNVSDEIPTSGELKTLHKTIKKVEEDIERFSFNTSVSTFMICVNELTVFKTNKRAILEPLVITLAPYAPHIAEELWKLLGHNESVAYAPFPVWEEKFLTENEFEYPVSVNGKTRGKITFPVNKPKEEIEKEVLESEVIQKYLEGKPVKKVIVVPNKIVNVVV